MFTEKDVRLAKDAILVRTHYEMYLYEGAPLAREDAATDYWNFLYNDYEMLDRGRTLQDFIAGVARGEEILLTAEVVETDRYETVSQGEAYKSSEGPMDSPWVEYPAGYVGTSQQYRSWALKRKGQR